MSDIQYVINCLSIIYKTTTALFSEPKPLWIPNIIGYLVPQTNYPQTTSMSKKLHNSEISAIPFSTSTGEEVGLELGAKMVKSFYDAYPEQYNTFLCGREIIERILAQPGCAGLSIMPALNEEGVRTLVFAGVDADGQQILKYTVIGETGALITCDGVISDRVITTPEPAGTTTTSSWF